MKNQHFFWISYSDLMTTLFFIMLVLFAVCYSVVKKTELDIKEYENLSELRNKVEEAQNKLEEEQEKNKKDKEELKAAQEQNEKDKEELAKKEQELEGKNKEIADKDTELKQKEKALEAAANEVKIAQDKYKRITDLTNSVKDLSDKLFKYNDKYKKHILNIDVKFKSGSEDLDALSDFRQSLLNSGREIKKLIDSKYKEFGTPFLVVIEGQASKGGWPEELDSIKMNDILSYKRARSLVSFWEQNGINLRAGNYNEKCELIIAGSGENGVMRETDDDSKNQRFLIHILPKPGKLFEKWE